MNILKSKKEEKKEKKEDKSKKGLWDKVFKKKSAEKGKVAILYLKNNGTADALELKSHNGFYTLGGKTYHERRDCVYTLTKDRIPLAIIPEWSMIPYGTKRWHDQDLLEKFAELQDHLLRGIRHAELVKMGARDKQLNMKSVVVWGILGIIALAVIIGYK